MLYCTMEKVIIYVSSLAICFTSILAYRYPLVRTRLGKIKGQFKTSYKGRTYEAYEGVPFALPPTGSRRFQPPEPMKAWSGVLSATSDPNLCMQFDYTINEVIGSEDCLYLNIYKPVTVNKQLLPVILWFHEGAFQRGSGNVTKAKYLIDRDVILVTMNYRLGPFGFLSTEDHIVPGNMGLKDQNMALRWLHQNIRAFRGDPQKISLLGVSAGGTSVHYHYLSPMSAGLFRNGISFSGTALSAWGFNPKPLEGTKKLAAKLDCDSNNTLLIANCLRTADSLEITNAAGEILKELTSQYFYYPLFVPVAERVENNYFINRPPEDILKSKNVYNVPWVTGTVSEEGGSVVAGIAFKEDALTYLDENWDDLAPYFLLYDNIVPEEQYKNIAEAAKQRYLAPGPLRVDNSTTFGLIYMKTDAAFHIVAEKSARLQAAATTSPVYSYYYSYRAAQSHSDALSRSSYNFGVSHLDDILLILENEFINPTVSTSDIEMMEKMLDFWYSTITTGKPDIGKKWPKVSPNSSNFDYMHIAGPHSTYVESNPNFGNKKFWNAIGVHY